MEGEWHDRRRRRGKREWSLREKEESEIKEGKDRSKRVGEGEKVGGDGTVVERIRR